MVVGYIVAAMFMAVLAVTLGNAGSMVLIACVGFFIFGAQAIMNNYQAMCYRTEIRGTGMGVAVGLNRIGGILGPVIVGVIASINSDPVWTFALFTGALVLAAGVIALGKTEIAALPASAQNAASVHDDAALPANAQHDPGVAG
jgi:AAHS family benzoate transporter-like MFS transporter/AAHS family 4-hydroxybenzoate transporter-like MFS transporter